MRIHLFVILSLGALGTGCGGGGGGGNNTTCGSGTVKDGDQCVADLPDASPGLTCGPGTQADNGSCVPIDAPLAGAPTIVSLDPGRAGISGGVPFTITGTGFAGPNVTDLSVTFGDQPATVGLANETTITGVVPPGTSIDAPVTVTTSLGTATAPFRYDALLAADGRGKDADLYAIDPHNGLSVNLGALLDTGGTSYSVTGLAFATDGTLYAATVPVEPPAFAPGDLAITGATTRQLVTIDLSSGTGVVTVVGDLVDANGEEQSIADIAFSGGTLYGWDEDNDFLVQIDLATGLVTPIGAPGDSSGSGLAVDSAGTIYHAGHGASGALDTVDPTTGVSTTVTTLVNPNASESSINAMTVSGSMLLGVINEGDEQGGARLVQLDPATGTETPLFVLPSRSGWGAMTDALTAVPETLATSRLVPSGRAWVAPPPLTAARTAHSACTAARVAGRTLGHHERVGLATLGHGAAHVVTCGGRTLDVAARDRGRYALVGNRRGQLKLVEVATGKTVARGITAVR